MTELERLKRADSLIQDMTEGRLCICTSSIGNSVYIHPEDEAYIGLDMIIKSNFEKACFDITFAGNIRRMGSTMSSKDLWHLHREVQQAQALLTALELTKFQPTQKDIALFREYLLQKQEQAPSEMQQEQMGC